MTKALINKAIAAVVKFDSDFPGHHINECNGARFTHYGESYRIYDSGEHYTVFRHSDTSIYDTAIGNIEKTEVTA